MVFYTKTPYFFNLKPQYAYVATDILVIYLIINLTRSFTDITMANHVQYQTVFIKGMLALDVDFTENEDVCSARLLIATQDHFMGDAITQYHNVIAIKGAANEVKFLNKGDAVEITGKVLWLESDYIVQTLDHDRQAEIIALTASKAENTGLTDSYQRMFMQGVVIGEPNHNAQMTGSVTNSLVSTTDIIMGDAIEQSHSIMALNELAGELKEYKAPSIIQVTGQLLWLDTATYTGDVIEEGRSVEIIVNSFNFISTVTNYNAQTISEQVDQNIKDLSVRIKESHSIQSAVYQQSILNKINSNKC